MEYLAYGGGNLGIGVIVTEDSIFNDYRPVIYQVVYHAIYDDIDVSEQININANELLRLPSAEELENPSFKRLGFVLLGWSTNPTSTEGYIKVGESIPIPENVDLYAVWEAKTFIIYIPEAIEISDDKQGIMTIAVDMELFEENDKIDVIIKNIGNLVLENTSIFLGYELSEDGTSNTFEEGDIIATFSNSNKNEKKILLSIIDEDVYYSGKYSDLITFEVNFSSEI